MRQHFQRTPVNQSLAELDGADSDNEGGLYDVAAAYLRKRKLLR
jgi:hypothetical protein